MSAKHIHHDLVIELLVADGWTITHDPLSLKAGKRDLHVDLGAERNTFAAERGEVKIGVEIQSFAAESDVRSLQQATGQFLMYRWLMATQWPQHKLYLAVPVEVHTGILAEPLGQLVVMESGIPLLVFDPDREEPLKWSG